MQRDTQTPCLTDADDSHASIRYEGNPFWASGLFKKLILRDSFITTTGADVSGAQHRLKTVLVRIFLSNTREFSYQIPENSQK